MRESQQPLETERESQELHGTGETVRGSQQPWEKVRDMQQLHGTETDSERQPATIEVRERLEATP